MFRIQGFRVCGCCGLQVVKGSTFGVDLVWDLGVFAADRVCRVWDLDDSGFVGLEIFKP